MIEKIATYIKKWVDWYKSDSCFLKDFVEALKITNSNIILTTPLILFIILTAFYHVFSSSGFGVVFSILMFCAMPAVFFSGWFYTVKLAVCEEYDKTDTFVLLKQFPTGVGRHFIDILLMCILFFIMLAFVIIFTYKSAYILIGGVGISRESLFTALSSPVAMQDLLTSLTPEQQMKFNYWNLYFIFTTTFYSFLVMFWAPEIIFKQESVLNAFIGSVVKLFRKFFQSLTIFSFIMFIYLIISLLSIFVYSMQFLSFLVNVLYFYFLVYAAVLIFLFYKREFYENE